MPFHTRHMERVHLKLAHPVGIYWADGATSRFVENPGLSFGGDANTNTDLLLKFDDNSGAPNESFHGASDDFGDIFVSEADAKTAGLDGPDWPAEDSRERTVFKLPAGTYKVRVYVRIKNIDADDDPNSISFKEVLTPATDKKLAETAFLRGEPSADIGICDLHMDEFVTDGTELYCVKVNVEDGNKFGSYHMRVERTGDA